MALVISTKYPTQSAAPDANYPQGSAQDITTPGDGTGTPWEADLINDWFGFFQKVLDEGGITPSGNPDTVVASDYYDGMVAIIGSEAATLITAGAWTAMTLINGWTSTRARYRLIDGGNRLEVDVSELDGTSSTSPEIFLLPLGYRPAQDFKYPNYFSLVSINGAYPNYISNVIPLTPGTRSFNVTPPMD